MASLIISSLAGLSDFAGSLARVCARHAYPAIFLAGELGAGKTTLVRFLVAHLSNGGECEVSSPSFNLCNIYPATPRILHWDLYRCGKNIPEALLEGLDDRQVWTIVEWAAFLEARDRPANFLDIKLKLNKNSRLLEICGFGERGMACATKLVAGQDFGKT